MGHKRTFQVPNDSRVEISLQCITIPFKGCSPAVLNKSAGFFLMSQWVLSPNDSKLLFFFLFFPPFFYKDLDSWVDEHAQTHTRIQTNTDGWPLGKWCNFTEHSISTRNTMLWHWFHSSCMGQLRRISHTSLPSHLPPFSVPRFIGCQLMAFSLLYFFYANAGIPLPGSSWQPQCSNAIPIVLTPIKYCIVCNSYQKINTWITMSKLVFPATAFDVQ